MVLQHLSGTSSSLTSLLCRQPKLILCGRRRFSSCPRWGEFCGLAFGQSSELLSKRCSSLRLLLAEAFKAVCELPCFSKLGLVRGELVLDLLKLALELCAPNRGFFGLRPAKPGFLELRLQACPCCLLTFKEGRVSWQETDDQIQSFDLLQQLRDELAVRGARQRFW